MDQGQPARSNRSPSQTDPSVAEESLHPSPVVAEDEQELTDAAGRRKTWLGVNTAVVVAATALMVLVAPEEQYLLLGLVLLAIDLST